MGQTREFFGLSGSQQNIWNLEQAYPGLPLNNICTSLYIEGNFRVDLLQKCIALAYEAYPVLRTRITRKDGQIMQYIQEEAPSPAPFIDFSRTNQSGVSVWNQSVAREHLPLYDSCLCQMTIFKLSEEQGGILTRVHHIIADAWSQATVTNHIIHNYFRLLQGEEPDGSLTPDYRNHIQAEKAYLESAAFGRDCDFWRGKLRDIPVTRIREHYYARVSPVGVRHSVHLPDRMNRMIAAFCEQKKVSPFALFYTGIVIWLARMKNQVRSCIGVPVINRMNYKEKQSGGMFVNTLPFINEIDPCMSLNEFNEKLKNDWFQLLYHQRIPFEEIRRILAAENEQVPEQIFGIALSYQNGKMDHLRGARVRMEGRWIYSGYQAESLCIHVSSRDAQNQFLVDYDYLTQIFSEEDIVRFHGQLMQILKEALLHPNLPVRDLNLISEEEEERLIFTFNHTGRWYHRDHSLRQELEERAGEFPERAALIWKGERMTYRELDEKARFLGERIAALLPGGQQNVAIWMERSVDLFVLMCAVAYSGNAWLLLDTGLPEGRIRMMLEEGEAALCIREGEWSADSSFSCRIMSKEELETAPPCREEERPEPSADERAYLVYTSGSTGKPKAVEILQRGLVNLACNMQDIYPQGAVLSLCSVGFDAFILESICALLCGRTVVVLPGEETNCPEALAEAIRRYAVGFLALTPSRLQVYLQNPLFRKAAARLECIVCGGETLSGELLAALRDVSGAELYNQYGPSEATVAVSHARITGEGRFTIGKPFYNCRIYILDEKLRPLAPGCAGELYIGGDCLAKGYFRDEELTKERFIPDPYVPGERIYRTGDMGEWTPEGEIVFLGRKDRQLKLLGHRIEPGEVEERLQLYPGVRQVAVTVAGNQLAAYYTAEQPVDADGLLAYGADYLPRYMLPVYARQLERLPFTPGGKVDYARLPVPEESPERGLPADETERIILDIWKRVLGKEQIGTGSDYFLSGGDSLNAVTMLAQVEKAFGKKLKLEEVYRYSTARKLAGFIRGRERQQEDALEKAPVRELYPLSPAQESFYVLEQSDETKKSYHMPGVFRIQGSLSLERLEKAFQRLAEEDALFRTGFEAGEEALQARVYREIPFTLEHLEGDSLEEILEGFVRPFDLAKPPLFRAGVCQSRGETWLLVDMHHILSDGISSRLVFERLDTYYRGEEVRLPAWSYQDYVWNLKKEKRETLEGYWEKVLEQGIPELSLPTDRPRPAVFDGRGGRVYFSLPRELEREVQDYCREHRETLFTFLFTGWALLLSGISGKKRFAVGTPLAGRRRQEFQETIGPFVNTLPVTVDFSGERTVEDCLEQTGKTVRDVIDSQDISAAELARRAGIRPARDKNPLYCTLFSLAPLNADSFSLGEASLEFVPQDTRAVKVDLHLEATPVKDGYRLCVEYASSLFDRETAAFYSRCYLQVLERMLKAPGQPLESLDMVSAGDRMRLLEEPVWLRTPYEAVCVDRMADRYAFWKAGETAAVWGEGESLTYGELAERAGEAAQALKERGVTRGSVVAFLPRRDGGMLVTMLAILKAGAAYLPVEGSFPLERIRYMLETAKAACLVIREGQEFAWEGDGYRCPVFTLEELRTEAPFTPVPERSPEDVANVIYTSGSTGRPKGVMMVHKALANLLCHAGDLLGDGEDCILCASSCVFDVFTTETLLALGRGRRISIADEEEMMFPAKMAKRILQDGVTILQLTPSRMQLGLGDETFCRAMKQIRILILMGEPWTGKLKERIKEISDTKIYNIYGPTETSVYNCQGEIRDVDAIHIGKPLGNCRYYLLDENRKAVMPTAEGEIYIAGECLAKGYVSRPDLTKEVFLEDPFFPGQKMYKTGDRGRLRVDGCWQCLGRVDTQLKLNGHRIEPEEIAGQIMESGLVSGAAVVPVREDGVPQYLCAFVTGGEKNREKEIFSWLAGRLPDYMVPSEIRFVSRIPQTASGKTDLRLLEEWARSLPEDTEEASGEPLEKEEPAKKEEPGAEEQREEPEQEENVTDIPGLLRQIWRQVLKREPREDTSFFAQGGTSLKAILALNQYYAYHLDLSLNDFYHAPTLKEQYVLLGAGEAGQEPSGKQGEARTGKTETDSGNAGEISRRELAFPEQGSALEVKGRTVLLTGATGYLGAHLLRVLLEMGAERVICLIRNLSDMRLRETLNFYFGDGFYLQNWGRIETVTGDMEEERLGMSRTAREELIRRTGLVVHAAADVRHYAPEEELYRANVKGTENLLSLARDAGCGFVHISTVSVAGSCLRETPERKAVFTERDLDIGQNWQENRYGKTKFLAEEKVALAAQEGMPVKVFRVGRLVARQRDGVFQKNPQSNAFYRLARGLLELGKLPRTLAEMPFELTPVDLAAEAVGRLLASPSCVFHILNSRTISLGQLLEACGPMETVEDGEFDQEIRRRAGKSGSGYTEAVAEMWISRREHTGNMEISSGRTGEELGKTGFFWEKPDREQMKKCLEGEQK